jgi:serine/threonine protein phosphatase 1
MHRTFVIGDIHGAYRALRQCLDRCGFDYENDHLICLGDVADGWPETKLAVDELQRIQNLNYILGNHDWWALQWMLAGKIEPLWYDQGGKATIDSYRDGIPSDHLTFLSDAKWYHIHENKLFVHAGINPSVPLQDQDKNTFLWDRSLALMALELYDRAAETKLSGFDEVYVGHTPIPYQAPVFSAGVWLMDTGAGWSGVLSMMDVITKETFISDPVPSLYPGFTGRTRRT